MIPQEQQNRDRIRFLTILFIIGLISYYNGGLAIYLFFLVCFRVFVLEKRITNLESKLIILLEHQKNKKKRQQQQQHN